MLVPLLYSEISTATEVVNHPLGIVLSMINIRNTKNKSCGDVIMPYPIKKIHKARSFNKDPKSSSSTQVKITCFF